MHGGSVEAKSAGPGQGSTSWCACPSSRAVPGPVRDSVAPEPALTHRILVVDDNLDSAEPRSRMLLQIAGNETFTAHDGESAFDRDRAAAPRRSCSTSACRP